MMLNAGHLTAKSDVYSFGVVLLELLTGRRSVDKARPQREQNLVEWARPMLNDPRKMGRIMDPRLEGQYSEMGARKAAALAYLCLSHRPRSRPSMTAVVKTLEPLQDFDDVPIAPFVYTVPPDNDSKESETPRERKKESNGHNRQRKHPLRSPRSRSGRSSGFHSPSDHQHRKSKGE